MVLLCDKPCGNKTESGYCATTACINPMYSNIGTAQFGQGVQKCIVTNADRIRAMTDEELADWVWGVETAGRAYGPRGKKAWLDWLKQEVDSD